MEVNCLSVFNRWFRKSSVCRAQFYPRQHDKYHDNDPDNQRNGSSAGLWRRLSRRQCRQHHSQWRYQRGNNDILGNGYNQALFTRGDDTRCWRRRTNGHHPYNQHKQCYKLLVCLLAVICFAPARAQDGGTTAIANPVATSTGSVSNQAVQINQGSYSQQGYGGGHTCNSSTLVLTPFYLGNDVNNPETAYIRNQNFGAQISLSMPLDFEMVRLCKDLAKRKIEKERLDYELVRILKCVEIKKAGYTIHPSSPYVGVCADVIPIAAAQK